MMYQDLRTEGNSVSLKDYLNSIRAHRLLILLSGLLGLALALWFTGTRTPSYEAESSVVLGPTMVGSTNENPRAPALEREMAIVGSDIVAEAVAARVPERDVDQLLEELDVLFVPESEILTIQATDIDPSVAAEIANAFAESYVEFTEQTAIDLVDSERIILVAQSEAALAKVNEFAVELERLDVLQTAIDIDIDISVAARRQESLKISQDRAIVQSQYGLALTDSRDLANELAKVERQMATREQSARVLVLAEEPDGPKGPSNGLVLIALTSIALLGGVVAAIVRDSIDITARDESTIATALQTRVLGHIPVLPLQSRRGPGAIVMRSNAQSIGSQRVREAFRRLRSAVQFLSIVQEDEGAMVIAATSAFPSEGKSVVASNLAVALAQNGARVALVNADLRRPSLERLFDVPNSETGLSLYLAGEAELEPTQIKDVRGLWILTAGPIPNNPAELLGSENFALMIQTLRGELDYVIVDCPPVLSAADPLAIAKHVDGFVVIVDSSTTETPDLVRTEAEITGAGGTLAGAILNRDGQDAGSWLNRGKHSYYRN